MQQIQPIIPLRFKFTAELTPIYNGQFRITIPTDWTPASKTDADKRATVKLVENPEATLTE